MSLRAVCQFCAWHEIDAVGLPACCLYVGGLGYLLIGEGSNFVPGTDLRFILKLVSYLRVEA